MEELSKKERIEARNAKIRDEYTKKEVEENGDGSDSSPDISDDIKNDVGIKTEKTIGRSEEEEEEEE